jgi:hypothetical protein
MSNSQTDQDTPWKLVLRQYFSDAIHFFFPQTAKLIDWSKPIVFLDTEFQQITPEAEIGRRYADVLVKVWHKRGQEVWLLLHLEVQASPDKQFSERLFIYNFRIFDQFHHPAISLAILCDGNPRWRPDRYEFNYPDTQLSFKFNAVKLLDYQTQWSTLEQSNNPFATVVMAHLKMIETKRNATDRKEWKFWLVRRLYEKGYSRQDVMNLFKFIDWIMVLPEGLKQSFWQELKVFEGERQMPYITSVEEIGFERGIEQGLERERSLILRQLNRKVGALSPQTLEQVNSLSIEQLESLGEALLDFGAIADLAQWLATQS